MYWGFSSFIASVGLWLYCPFRKKIYLWPSSESETSGNYNQSPGDVIEWLQVLPVPVKVWRVEQVWREVHDVTQRKYFAGFFQDGALRHLDVASGLQVVAQKLNGVDQLIQTEKITSLIWLITKYITINKFIHCIKRALKRHKMLKFIKDIEWIDLILDDEVPYLCSNKFHGCFSHIF